MDTKKKVLIFGAAALLVMSAIMVASAAGQGAWLNGKGFRGVGWGRHAPSGNFTGLSSLGLPENATGEQVSDALWEKHLKELGLTDDSTMRQYRQALKAKMQANQEQRLQSLREKLNLPGNATTDDIRGAMRQLRGGRGGLLQGNGKRLGCGMREGGPGRDAQETDSQ